MHSISQCSASTASFPRKRAAPATIRRRSSRSTSTAISTRSSLRVVLSASATEPGADLAHWPPGAGLQDDRRFPPRQRPRDPQGVRQFVAFAATSTFWTPVSSRSTAASSKPLTPRRRASRARSCVGGWARSMRRSTGIWPSWTARTKS